MQEILEIKSMEYRFIRARWIIAFFLGFFIVLFGSAENVSISPHIQRCIWSVVGVSFYVFVYNILYFLYVKFTNKLSLLDLGTHIVIILDCIAIATGGYWITQFSILPIESLFIILQICILIRFRATIPTILWNAVLISIMVLSEAFLFFQFPPFHKEWQLRTLYWFITMFFIPVLLWELMREYQKLKDDKEIECANLAHSKNNIHNLIKINEVSAALNDCLSQNEIIKILLQNISEMTGSDECSLMMYSKTPNEGYMYHFKEFKELNKDSDPIQYKRVYFGDEIRKIKNMKDYKHVVGAQQPFYMMDLVHVYNLKEVVLNPQKKWFYMFKLMCSMKESGFLLVATDEQLEQELGQSISLLVLQAGTAISTAILYNATKRKANTDPLTGAKTRRYLKDFLKKEIYRAERYERKFCVLFFDIDNFKKFNDTYGHKVGDEVLKIITKLSNEAVRSTDLVSRYGGEEFVIVLSETDFNRGCEVAERIRSSIAEYSLQKELGIEQQLTVSIGLAEYPVDANIDEDIIIKADWGMYAAKRNGKNQVKAFRECSELFEKDHEKGYCELPKKG